MAVRAMVLVAMAWALWAAPARGADVPLTPKAVGLAFTKAVAAGDAATAKSLATGGETDMAVVDAMTDMVVAMRKLAEAATAKYGADGAELAALNPSERIAMQFTDAKEKIEGSAAALLTPAGNPLRLKKVEGVWRVDLAAMMKEDEGRKAIPYFKATTKAASEVADEIGQGKYKTAGEAQKAFGAKADQPLAPADAK